MSADRLGFVNVFGSRVGCDDDGWYVAARIDGHEQIISRHASREAAEAGSRDLNESANPQFEEDHDADAR